MSVSQAVANQVCPHVSLNASMVGVDSLRPHPVNTRVFGVPEVRPDLLHAIDQMGGIMEPLLVLADLTIVSGHTRWACAKELGIEEVPVRYVEGKVDDVHVLDIIFFANSHREKDYEHYRKMIIEIERIEKARAAARMSAGIGEDGEAGSVRDIIAKRLGLGGGTINKLKRVTESIQELRDAGSPIESIEKVIKTSAESPTRAIRLCNRLLDPDGAAIANGEAGDHNGELPDYGVVEKTPAGQEVPEDDEYLQMAFGPTLHAFESFHKDVGALRKKYEALVADYGEQCGAELLSTITQYYEGNKQIDYADVKDSPGSITAKNDHIEKLLRQISSIKTHAICQVCGGSGEVGSRRSSRSCEPCNGYGWLNKTAWKHQNRSAN